MPLHLGSHSSNYVYVLPFPLGWGRGEFCLPVAFSLISPKSFAISQWNLSFAPTTAYKDILGWISKQCFHLKKKQTKMAFSVFNIFFWANKKHCGITFLISENNLIKKNTFRFAGSVSKRSLFASVITCLTDVSWLNDHKHEADFTMGRKAAISQRQWPPMTFKKSSHNAEGQMWSHPDLNHT